MKEVVLMQKSLSISIEDGKKIQLIQQEFNAMFPYLKIEFFSTPHKNNEGSAKKIIRSSYSTIGECRSIHNSGVVYITADMSVKDLEQMFYNTFGLSTQVFRKSGRVWLETTVTDKWTLEKQNHEGEELSKHLLSDDRNN